MSASPVLGVCPAPRSPAATTPLRMVLPLSSATADVPPARLSARDREILVLLTWGRTTREAADELFVSVDAVRTYIRSAYQKVGVTRRSQAVAWGLRNGLSASPTVTGPSATIAAEVAS